MSKNPKILFISRAYPPTIGGIENQNYGIATELSRLTSVKIIANTRGKKFLPIFLVQAFFIALFSLWKYDVVLFGDGVPTPLGVFLKFFHPKKKFASIVHGLDITFAHKKSLMGKLYRLANVPALKKMNKLIMVGNHTISEATKLGIAREKCVFIPNGFDEDKVCDNFNRKNLEEFLDMDLSDKKVILRVGRFVKHKGLDWFIDKVMPQLPENYILLGAGGRVAKRTVGDSDTFPICEENIKKNNLEARVKLFPNIAQEKMNLLFNTVDMLVSPNVSVPGSMEGFGINAIEGTACAKVVVASDLEGLKDAIINGQNGFMVEPGNADKYAQKIKAILQDDNFRVAFGKRAQTYSFANFSWEVVGKKYLEELKNI
ncbi:MAG: Glycosyl transferase, group 1 family [uncultured bacterium]|nr:MAG: Glycosyl transferase, group 1 family [uncultured bacterium]KKP68773.1 MAG: Glycosyl transferase, group 1 family [Candidatus Moranbacteria bacterium GW2011_GWE1_35_17]KKP71969.1 MAG: Glycosyl transferase, group 1 family [Candidatus Moranbacteria bacterium GW2011_GWE2_35_164]KKP82867.1 MAG: Glycosyl transferase, group 1 family [Candidatus Moranbacteria bacterium GW2011_GWF2_35_54]KKP84191.1 MAG: Glycosyl transferase, group 1 family [Candidatus Moranbacteria bacterium GW2011_GWF1_35_5]HBR